MNRVIADSRLTIHDFRLTIQQFAIRNRLTLLPMTRSREKYDRQDALDGIRERSTVHQWVG